MNVPDRGLYAILDASHVAPSDMPHAAAAAFAGGAAMLQYRDKAADTASRRTTARALYAVAQAAGQPLIVNDDPALAAAVGADGVHLGRGDTGIAAARALLGERAIVGATCHGSLDDARDAVAAGADYVSFGRFFASATKPQAPAAAVDVLTRAKRELTVPIVAIGGVNADNGDRLLAAGADLLAAAGAVFNAGNVETAARKLVTLFD